MAKAGQVDTPSATSPQIASISESESTPLPQRDRSPQLVNHQLLLGINISQQVPEGAPPEATAPEDLDDEVEFVFSVPRRRRKKRKRYGRNSFL